MESSDQKIKSDNIDGFTSDVILRVWQKAQIDEYNAPNDFRKDQCGAWIERTEYGNQNSAFGWEIDFIKPELNLDLCDLTNLRPLHWKNKFRNEHGTLTCAVTSFGTTNVDQN